MNNCLMKNQKNNSMKQTFRNIYQKKVPKCEFCDTILVSNVCPHGHKKHNGSWVRCGINGCHIPTTNNTCPCMSGYDLDLYDTGSYTPNPPTIVEEE
jgi:hypothetical protein